MTDHLLATVIDAVGVAGYHALLGPHVDPKKLRSVKPPEPMTRPGVAARRRHHRRKATADDLKQIFGGGATAYRPGGN